MSEKTKESASTSSSSAGAEEPVPIVFIHGFKGAQLINTKTKCTEWVTAFQTFGLSRIFYDLPITWKDPDTQDRDDIVVGDPLSYIAYFIDIYGTLLSWGKRQGRPFHSYTWDWRRSPFEAVDGLRKLLEKIGRPCQLLCHSMGSLIGYVTVQKAYEEGGAALAHRLVHSLLCVGPPFKPMEAYLAVTGSNVSSRRSSPRTAFTMPSSFVFIPVYGNDDKCGDPEYWVKHKIGAYLQSTGGKLTEQEMVHFRMCLDLTRRFQKLLLAPLPKGHPPIAILASDTVNTGVSLDVENPDYDKPGMGPGDGTVPFESAMGYPEGVNVIAVEKSTRDHVGLCKETQKIEELLAKLLDYKNDKSEEVKEEEKEESDEKDEK